MSNILVFPGTEEMNKEVERVQSLILPGTGFGVDVSHCTSAAEVLDTAGLNWDVYLEQNRGSRGNLIDNSYTLYRDLDNQPVGINLTQRYVPLQNRDAIGFADFLLPEGFQFLRAGAFYGGSRIWLMGKLPENKNIAGDDFGQYLVISNSHDKSSSFRAAIVPIRIACSNALNMVFKKATFFWGIRHNSEMMWKLDDARQTVAMATGYMDALKEEMERLTTIDLTHKEVNNLIETLFPIDLDKELTARQIANIQTKREVVNDIFYRKDDLAGLPVTAYRFVQAVADYATHKNNSEHHFLNTLDGLKEVKDAYNLFAA